ncbi:MAG: hypothetical protein CM1200mP16_14960 [Nitrospina sp.]|nr:MAG: hypothetical protein CM1200mP16_14960 [Nitrospina sp.]
MIGRVEETIWRTTRLWTTDRNLVIVPNSYITSTIVTNYSMPEVKARFDLDYTLDFSVPSERAIAFLMPHTQIRWIKGAISRSTPKNYFNRSRQ